MAYKGYNGKTFQLVGADGHAVIAGSTVEDGEDSWILESATAPHKEASTGRVYVKLSNPKEGDYTGTREFFPSVVGLKFVEI